MSYPLFAAMYRALLPEGDDPNKAVNAKAAIDEFRAARAERLKAQHPS